VKLYVLVLIISVFLAIVPTLVSAADDSLKTGIAAYRAENFEEAEGFLSAARMEKPESSAAAFYLGMARKQMADYPAAEQQFRDSLTLTPPVEDAYVELVEVLYVLEKLDEAMLWLEKAEKTGRKPGQVEFLRGLVLMKKGDNGKAVAAFKRAKQRDPALSQEADFQTALALVRERRFREAKKSLDLIREMDPSTDAASLALEYDRALTRTIEATKSWRLSAGVGYQYDDNVILLPSGGITGLSITGKADSSVVATFGAAYSPLTNGPLSFNAWYNFYSNTYFKTGSHNIIAQSLAVSPSYRIKNWSLSLPLSYSHAWLHERSYMGLISVKPTAQIAVTPEHIFQFSAGYGAQDLVQPPTDPNEDRDAKVLSLSVGYFRPFDNGRGLFNISYEFLNSNADGRNWDNTGNHLTASLLLPVGPGNTALVIAADALLQDYRNIHTVFDVRRKDRTYTGSANLRRDLGKGFVLNLQYSHTRADSNISVYDYNRNVYTAGIEYRF